MPSQILGMADDLTLTLGLQGFNALKLVPYGELQQVLPWLLRRLDENQASQQVSGRVVLTFASRGAPPTMPLPAYLNALTCMNIRTRWAPVLRRGLFFAKRCAGARFGRLVSPLECTFQ